MERRYGDLLHPAQRDFLDAFSQLNKNARALLVRLLSRKGQLFRIERLSYTEIGGLSGPLQALENSGLLSRVGPADESLDWSALLSLYTKPELLQWLGKLSTEFESAAALKRLGRANLDELLVNALQQGELKYSDILVLMLPGESSDAEKACDQGVVQLVDWLDEAMDRFRLLYFGNLHQGMTDFVLRDLGVQAYADYLLNAESRLFQSREQIEQHLALSRLNLADEELKLLNADQLLGLHLSLPFRPEDRVLKRRTARLRVRIGRQLERLNENALAYRVYRHCPVPPARERRIRLLSKLLPTEELKQSKTQAVQRATKRTLLACQRLYQAPSNDAEFTFARQFATRLTSQFAKKQTNSKQPWQAPSWIQQLNSPAITEREIQVSKQALAEASSVEALALECLKQPQSDLACCSGFYVENALFTALFGLLYWPVIFAEIPGAFFHPFQRKPDDLYEADFADARQAQIKAVEAQIHSGGWQQQIRQNARRYVGIQNPFVHWGFVTHAQENGCFELALERITADQILAISRNLLGDLKYRRAGLPDLIVFPDQGGFELIEVKGPNDSLQPHQIGWLAFFQRKKIPASVLYLRF